MLLHMASEMGDFKTVNDLCSVQNMDPNMLIKGGYTPMHLAAMWGKTRVIMYLVENTELGWRSLYIMDDRGYIPLHYACARGHLSAVKYLLKMCKEHRKHVTNVPIEVTEKEIPAVTTEEAFPLAIEPQKSLTPKPWKVYTPPLPKTEKEDDNELVVRGTKFSDRFVSVPKKKESIMDIPDIPAPQVYGNKGLPKETQAATDRVEIVEDYLDEAKNKFGSPVIVDKSGPDTESFIHSSQNAAESIQDKDMINGNVLSEETTRNLLEPDTHQNDLLENKEPRQCDVEPNFAATDGGYLPVHLSCASGNLTITKFLLEEEQPEIVSQILRSRTKNSWNVMHLACGYGHEKIVKYLLNTHNLDNLIPAEGNFGSNCMHLAAWQGNTSVINLLSKNDFGVEALFQKNSGQYTPLLLSCSMGHLEVCKNLIKMYSTRPDVLNQVDGHGKTSMHHFSSKKNADLVRQIINAGGFQSIYQKDDQEMTPLLIACKENDLDALEALIRGGGYAGGMSIGRELTTMNEGALHYLAKFGGVQEVRLVVNETGAKDLVRQANLAGNNILHLCAMDGDVDVMKYFVHQLELGPMMNDVNKKDVNPFHMACLRGDIEMVKFIYKSTCAKDNILWKNIYGYSALYYASKSDCLEVVRFLVEETPASRLVNDTCDNGSTPLHNACKNGSSSIVEYLLDNGAEPSLNLVTQSGNTPLHEICRGGMDSYMSGAIHELLKDMTDETRPPRPPHKIDTCRWLNTFVSLFHGENKRMLTVMMCSVNKEGSIPLHLAIRTGKLELSSHLITECINIGAFHLFSIANKSKRRPFNEARTIKMQGIVGAFSQIVFGEALFEDKPSVRTEVPSTNSNCISIKP